MCTGKFVFLILFIAAITAIPLAAQDLENKNSIREGITVFKISPNAGLKQGFLEQGLTGQVALDSIFISIKANRIERTFPFCDEPEIGKTDLTRIFTVYYPKTVTVQSVCQSLNKLDIVEYAEPWYICYLDMEHNDPMREDQWGLDICNANEAHDIHIGNLDTPIAIIDTGMDMDHPDLIPNLWVNPGEDLNGDGQIQEWEINGIDDENNGVADDFHGWDFIMNDNNPEDERVEDGNHSWGHGTHCAGIASAATNNHRGVASLGFNCPIIPVRVGRGEVWYGYQGIVYAANCRAKIISCSWGGGEGTEWCQESINYAYEHNALVFASAGNDDGSAPHYPSDYHHVVSVAATTPSDQKAGFSNYGGTVDISAPGVDILSTFVEGGYASLQGTSMACPFAAGLGLLIRATYPQMDVDGTEACILNASDNINDVNPQYHNLLGRGRINAARSLRWGAFPRLVMEDPQIHQHVDQTDIISLTLNFRNIGNSVTARHITARISTDDPSLHILTPYILIDPVEPRLEVRNEQFPFDIEIDNNAIPHLATVTVTSRFREVFVAENVNIQIPVGLWVEDSVEESPDPDQFFVSTAFPNPFNSTTQILYSLNRISNVNVRVFNPLGQHMAQLVNEWQPVGYHKTTWDCRDNPSGTYYMQFQINGVCFSRKLIITK